MITLALKKSILNDWNAIIPQLSTYSQTTLYVTLDIMVVGLLLLRVRGEDEYRPIFQVYPLWKRDNKDNLFSPIVNKPILDKKNLTFDIPYNQHSNYFKESIRCAEEQVGCCLRPEVLVEKMFDLINSYYSNDYLVQCNPICQADLLELQLYIMKYICDYRSIDKMLNNINKASKKWKYQYFYENYSTEDWKNSVLKNIDDWDNVLKLLKTNMDDKKIARLKHSHLVY